MIINNITYKYSNNTHQYKIINNHNIYNIFGMYNINMDREFLMNNIIQNYIYVTNNYIPNKKYYINFLYYIIDVHTPSKQKIIIDGYYLSNNNKISLRITHSYKLYKFFISSSIVKLCGLITMYENYYYCYMPMIEHKTSGLHINHNAKTIKQLISIANSVPSLTSLLKSLIIPTSVKDAQYSMYKLLMYEIAIKRHMLNIAKTLKTPKSIDNINIKMPFDLNEYQQKVLYDIKQNLNNQYRTSHLIYGDVGSGKTILAYIAACITYHNQQNVCIMVPNLILVKQIANNFREWDNSLNIIEITGAVKKINTNNIAIFIGTHAVLNRNLPSLGLLIIDEQQKFGVIQRNQLVGQETDILMLSATPIPRTLQMALIGVLSYSILNQSKSKNIMQVAKTTHIGEILQQVLNKSSYMKIFWVEATIEEAQNRQKEFILLGQSNTHLVHSKIKTRQQVISDFINSSNNGILVGTTVLEVGIDSDINMIVINNADKMGVSQLHQLNGRVGRRGIPGKVILIGNNIYKLKTLQELNNGFEIAKWDLRQRGGSNMLQKLQSGFTEFKFNYKLNNNLVWEYIDTIHENIILKSQDIKINNEIIEFIYGDVLKDMNIST